MARKNIFVALALAIFLFAGANARADELILNGGFENYTIIDSNARPDSWGWSQNAFSYTASPVISPNSGDRMGVLAPGGSASQEFWQQVDFTGLSQAQLSFSWAFDARDYDEADNGRDKLEIFIATNYLPTNGSLVNVNDPNIDWDRIWSADVNVDPEDGWVTSPWMFVSLSGDVSDLGLTTFCFHLTNNNSNGRWGEANWTDGDDINYGQQTVLFLDDVSIKPIPEPTSILLLGTGLGVLGLGIWRRKKSV